MYRPAPTQSEGSVITGEGATYLPEGVEYTMYAQPSPYCSVSDIFSDEHDLLITIISLCRKTSKDIHPLFHPIVNVLAFGRNSFCMFWAFTVPDLLRNR